MQDGNLPHSPVAQPPVRHEPLAKAPRKKGNAGRLLIHVESIRGRLIDDDNLCPKFFIDCLRYAGIIPDDSKEVCTIVTTQRKVRKGESPRTEITITPLTNDQNTANQIASLWRGQA